MYFVVHAAFVCIKLMMIVCLQCNMCNVVRGAIIMSWVRLAARALRLRASCSYFLCSCHQAVLFNTDGCAAPKATVGVASLWSCSGSYHMDSRPTKRRSSPCIRSNIMTPFIRPHRLNVVDGCGLLLQMS